MRIVALGTEGGLEGRKLRGMRSRSWAIVSRCFLIADWVKRSLTGWRIVAMLIRPSAKPSSCGRLVVRVHVRSKSCELRLLLLRRRGVRGSRRQVHWRISQCGSRLLLLDQLRRVHPRVAGPAAVLCFVVRISVLHLHVAITVAAVRPSTLRRARRRCIHRWSTRRDRRGCVRVCLHRGQLCCVARRLRRLALRVRSVARLAVRGWALSGVLRPLLIHSGLAVAEEAC